MKQIWTPYIFAVWEFICQPLYVDYADRSAFKHADKIQKDGFWIMPDHGYKDLRFAQKIDDPRSYYPALRGMNKKILFFYLFFIFTGMLSNLNHLS